MTLISFLLPEVLMISELVPCSFSKPEAQLNFLRLACWDWALIFIKWGERGH